MAARAASITPDDVAIALRVLQAASQRDDEDADALRAQLMPAIQSVTRREKQARRRANAEAADASAHDAAHTAPEEPGAATPHDGQPPEISLVESVLVDAAQLSRVLYTNPVCFLSTWDGTGSGAHNLMTISWLAALDNDGHFTLSMNQRRFSARLLAANPVFVLSVACAGLETLLLRTGGCTGARLACKTETLGVPLCRPGWLPRSNTASQNSPTQPTPPIRGGHDLGSDAQSMLPDTDWDCRGWPKSESEVVTLPPPARQEEMLAGAVAVEPCVAHVVARVEAVRCVHGHLQLTCATIRAHVRRDYWSGKTLEPQVPGLPPLLNFLGSQRFRAQQPPA
jgi:flavin reductase (DIM6/NTAB) family NADH-FMN oxidoreductase RutF